MAAQVCGKRFILAIDSYEALVSFQ